jgi:D-alanyl-D-alanine carboxypeptidase/N-acetylmuramoyl-L-alanine amidase
MALDRPSINFKTKFVPKYFKDSGALGVGQSQRTAKPLTEGANQQVLNSSSLVKDISGTSLFSTKTEHKLAQNKQVIGIGQTRASVNIASVGGGFNDNSKPINQVENFLKQIKTTTDQGFAKSIAQANSSTGAYSVGRGQTRHEQIKADEKVILSQKQDQVVNLVQKRQVDLAGKIEEGQAILFNSKSLAKDVGFDQNVKDKSYVELPQLNKPQAIDGKLASRNAQEIGESVVDKIVGDVAEMTTARIAATLKVKRPIVGDKGCGVDAKTNFLLPEDNVHSYEFYVEVDPSEDREVFDYILKYRSKIDDKKWFSFYIGGVGYTQTPSWVSLNYGVPPMRFSTDKVLYFFVKVKSGKAIDTVKNFYFYDTTAKTNTPDAKHLVLKGIRVYYKKEAGQYYYTPEAYERKVAGSESVGRRESTAVEFDGTLSKENPVDSNKNEIEKIAEGIKSSELVNATHVQGKEVIAVGQSTNKQEAKTVGEHEGAQKVGGDHQGQHQGGQHEFHAHSSAVPIGTDPAILVVGTGAAIAGTTAVLVGASKIRSISPVSANIRKSFVPKSRSGAAAVGSSGQDIRGVTGSGIQAYQSGGFQQQGSFGTSRNIGTSNFGNGFGGSKIRGLTNIANLQSGQTFIAGGNSDSVLFFAQPGQEKEFAQFQNPLAGIGQVTIIPTELDGSINQRLLSPAARASLSSINNSTKSSGGNYGSSNLSNKGVGGKPIGGRKFGSGVGDNGGNNGNKPPRRPGLGGLEDLPDKPEDEDENNFDNLRKMGLGFGASNLDGENSFQIDGEPENVENQIYENGINLVGDKPKTGGRIRIDQDPDGQNAFKNLPRRLKEQRINDIRSNPTARARQGQNAFGEKYKSEALDRVKNKFIDNLVKKGLAQAATFLGGLLLNPVTWIVLASIILGLLIGAAVITSYCYPREQLKTLRDSIEPIALTVDAVGGSQSPLETAANVTKLGFNISPVGLVVNTITGGSTLPSSQFRKWIESNPVCDKSSANCAQSGAGDALAGAIGKAEGKLKAEECTKLKEYKSFIEKASSDYGIPAAILGGLISRESNAGLILKPEGCAGLGDAGNGHGLVQIDGSSGAWGGSARGSRAAGTPTNVKDKDGKPFIWDNCESNIRYGAFHLQEFIKFYGAKLEARGATKSSYTWWRQILNANNHGSPCASNDSDDCTTANEGVKNYGSDVLNRAADAAKCLGITNTTTAFLNLDFISPSHTAYLDTRQQDQANKYWSEAFGFPVLAKFGEQIKNPVLTGLEVLDARILAFNKVMGGKVSVEAAESSSSSSSEATKDDPITEATLRTNLATRITTDKIRVWTKNHTQLDYIEDSKVINIELVKMILAMSDGYSIFITALGSRTHSPGSQHEKGEAVDIGSVEASNENVDNGDPKVIAGFVDKFYSSTFISQLLSNNTLKAKLKAAGAKATFVDNIDDGEGHLHFGINSSAKWGGAAPLTGNNIVSEVCECPTNTSGGISSATGPGTVSTGGVFTPEVRAFLDTIANWEAEGADKLGPISYNSGNKKANLFDATKYASSYPTIDSPGNGGRYQVKPTGDKEDADKWLKVTGLPQVTGFDAKNQDLFAVGRWLYRAGDKKEKKSFQEMLTTNFEGAVGLASSEWASAPIVPGYTHAGQSQSKANLATYKAYYEQRLAVYKKTSWLDIPNIFGGVVASAATATTDLRTKLAKLVEDGKIFKIGGQEGKEGEIKNIKEIYDDNLIRYYDNLWESGLSPVLGPKNYRGGTPGSGAGHSYATAVDIWGLALRSEVESGGPLKAFDGPTPMHTSSATETENNPSKEGNKSDPRIVRMADLLVLDKGSDLYKKTIERFNLADSIAFGSGVANFAITHEVHFQAISPKRGDVKGHKDPSVYKSGGGFYNGTNGHHSHYHVQFNPAKNGVYKSNTGLGGALSPSCSNKPCPVAPVPIPTTPTEPVINGSVNQDQGDEEGFLNIFSAIKASAVGAPTSYSGLSAEHKKLLAEVAAAVKAPVSVDGGGDKPEMKAAYNKLKADAATKGFTLEIKSGYKSTDTQMITYFQNGEDDKITEYYSEGMSASDRERVKKGYVKRAESSYPPGFSEHATGSAIDIYASNKPPSISLSRKNYPEDLAKYLADNAPKFGFDLSYGKDSGGAGGGAKYEPWHWYFGKSPSKGGASSTSASLADCAKTGASGGAYTNSNVINKEADQKYMATSESQKLWTNLQSPAMVIIHYTAVGNNSFESVADAFKDAIAKGPGKSGNQGWAHYIIDKGGEKYQFMPEDKKVSGSAKATGFYWKDNQQLIVNDHAVQYEIHYDAGNSFNQSISDAQLQSLAKTIIKSGFKSDQIFTHWAVQPFDRDDSKDWIPNNGTVSPMLIKFVKYAGWATNDIEATKIAKQIIKQNIENAIKVHETLGSVTAEDGSKPDQNKLPDLKAGLQKINS